MLRPITVAAAAVALVAFLVVQVSGAAYTAITWDHLFNYPQKHAPGRGRPSRYCASCEKPCGAQPAERRSAFAKIVNGKDTRENEFGWAATLSRRGQFYCGGTLITKMHILTAAHCVENFNPKDLTVTIGEHDRKVETGRKSVHHVAKIYRHPDFKLSTFDNDIAIVELRDVVSIENPWVRVACLPKTAYSTYEGEKGTVIGWGRLGERKKSSNILQKVDVPIISNEDCKEMGYLPEKITSNMICAGYKEGMSDACQGDSGGPMHRHADSSDVLEVIGIVSWGKGCARENYPGVYTRVANYLEWIMDHTGNECICGAESS
ncbi:Serine proteases, trypsin family, serine active site,Peptidase S1, PA clan,Serine proteases, trypsin [Cinara cedri]|uniref:Serine proteases, trypsin family, serine active site,Peptidase S1, PA clan,Serine proteases, trypsin n=1 Tax=Cinara cedri TaxID=506608 RepID=A0A5E4MN13_9HEMI|nr:Serine proteases, trypsin family, serine active site,Peptidase S1, PA clan,Serine proteases, trypsin [Cinara cedri]